MLGETMETSFIAVINDPLNPIERTKEDGSPVLNKHGVKKTFTQSYKIEISGDNAAQFLGRSIGDEVDGIYIGDGETTLSGYKLQITGGSDKTGTPMRADIDGGGRKSVLVHASTGFKGTVRVTKSKKGEKRVFRSKPAGMRKRRNFRGRIITADTRQINLKVIEAGSIPLERIMGSGDDAQ